jgi:hypothetical protein
MHVSHVLVQHHHHIVSVFGLSSSHVMFQHQNHLSYASFLPVTLHTMVQGESNARPSLSHGLGAPHLQHNTKGRVKIHIYIYNHMLHYQNHKT